MPELANRADHERELSAAVLLLLNDYRDEAAAILAVRPVATLIPASFYQRLSADIERVVFEHLSRVSSAAGDNLAAELGVPASEAARRSAIEWARQRAAAIARDFVERTREWIAEQVAKATAESDTAAIAAVAAATGMAAVFSETRARTLGVTETTEAQSAGEMNAARQMERDYRVKVIAYWVVDESSNVCPICSRCHGKPQEFWERYFPSGPPGHPNCACHLRFQVLGSLPRFSEN